MSDEIEKLPDGPEGHETPASEEPKEPIRWVTKGQRVAAWIAAIAVILITISYIYSIYSGALFSR